RAVDQQDVAGLRGSLAWIERSLKAYADLVARGSLSAVQSNRRDAVVRMHFLLDEVMAAFPWPACPSGLAAVCASVARRLALVHVCCAAVLDALNGGAAVFLAGVRSRT